MAKHKLNPAGRLHAVLKEGSEETLDNLPCREAWARMLQLPDSSDTIRIYRELGILMDQVDKAERILKEMKSINHQLYLRSFPAIRDAIAWPTLDSNWSGPRRCITGKVLTELEFCSEKIAELYPEKEIEAEALRSLLSEVEHLQAQVLDSGIGLEIKEILCSLLEEMRRAIIEYRLRGAAGLREAMAKSIGLIATGLQHAGSSAEREPFNRCMKVLAKAEQILARAIKYTPLLASIYRFVLGDGEHQSP